MIFFRTWWAAPHLCCQNKFDLSIILQAALQPCWGIRLLCSELGRLLCSCARECVSFLVRTRQKPPQQCCDDTFHSFAVWQSDLQSCCWNSFRTWQTALWLCCRNKSDLCKTWQPALQWCWNKTSTIMSSPQSDFQ